MDKLTFENGAASFMFVYFFMVLVMGTQSQILEHYITGVFTWTMVLWWIATILYFFIVVKQVARAFMLEFEVKALKKRLEAGK